MAEVHSGPSGLDHTLVAHEALERAEKETGTKLQRLDKKLTELVTDLEETLAKFSNIKRAAKYSESLNKIQAEAQLPRLVIGVLGDTGSGKSSLINAVLDESRVVPTNCMRACTAVITEILWNSAADGAKKYRAEIHFMTQAEWTAELMRLHRDVLDADGKISRDTRHLESDAGTAYAILRAVYPELSDEELERTHPTALASIPAVREVTGSTLLFEDRNCDTFYSKIQAYVDSDDDSNSPGTIAYWPLIKVVRVFLKSEVLSTGVVLVDLPGGRDSNAARAAVAAKYIKECTRLWVVTDINRAVNDKTAKTLMGHNFKQQLKYDDSYSSITFICTKADQITLDEAAETLGITDEISEMYETWTELKPRIDTKKRDLKQLESRKTTIKAQSQLIDNDMGNWRGIYDQAANGERAFRPFESPQKRKRQESDAGRKRSRPNDSSDSEDNTSDESDTDGESMDVDDQREPVTVEEAQAKLADLKQTKKSLKDEKKQIIHQVCEQKAAIAALTKQRSEMNTEIHRKCIQGRNDYSREEIKKDFAFGLKELEDELLAEQEDGQEQLQQQKETNYDEVGNSLPVFCVSSRGYQQLRGRMKKDQRVVGFCSLGDTQVPGLRQHTLEIAASMQDVYFKRHVEQVDRFFRGMDLFLSGDDTLLKMSDAEREAECEYLDRALDKLRKEFEDALADCTANCGKAVKNVLRCLPRAACKAATDALATAQSWGLSPKSGGLRYGTYKATCRRRGVFKGSAGPRDFNEGNLTQYTARPSFHTHFDDYDQLLTEVVDLLKPLKQATAKYWDQAFNKEIPDVLGTLTTRLENLITTFHQMMRARRFLSENSNAVHRVLNKHIAAMDKTLVHINIQHKKMVKREQRGANRLFNPAIESSLQDVYNQCVQVGGSGAFLVLKQLMEEKVQNEKDTMFDNATTEVGNAVDQMLKDVESTIRKNLAQILATMEQDYTGLIGTAASAADKRDRKILQPVLNDFYQKLVIELNAEAEAEVVGDAGVAYHVDEADSEELSMYEDE